MFTLTMKSLLTTTTNNARAAADRIITMVSQASAEDEAMMDLDVQRNVWRARREMRLNSK